MRTCALLSRQGEVPKPAPGGRPWACP